MKNAKKDRSVRTIAVAATLLATGVAWGAAGDLDPTFGNGGIARPELPGTLRALREHAGQLIVGGGDSWSGAPFFTRPLYTRYAATLGPDGSLGQTLWTSGYVGKTFYTPVVDLAVRDDSSVIAISRGSYTAGPTPVAVPALTDSASIVIDDSGRLVIAGSQQDHVAVVRLLSNGSLDATFGAGGVFVDPGTGSGSGRILRTTDGYRVAFVGSREINPGIYSNGCHILALNEDGTLNTAFGNAGYVAIGPLAGNGALCPAFAAGPGDSLSVGGNSGGHGYLLRLLGNGVPDPGFHAPDAASFVPAAIASFPDGSLIVAGWPPSTLAPVARRRPDGSLDTSFGDAGTAWIPVPTTTSIVTAVVTTSDGGVVVGGGVKPWPDLAYANPPFLVKLIGDSSPGGPGLVGMERTFVTAPPAPGSVLMNVRRVGGSAGAVSVAFETQPSDHQAATAGFDYVDTSGRLEWADGDATTKIIEVPVLDTSCQARTEPLRFMVRLSDPTGGAALAQQFAAVDILPASPHATSVQFTASSVNADEAQRRATISLRREGDPTCPVSVTLSARAETATAGLDYQFAEGTTVDWPAGDASEKSVTIVITEDDQVETAETFTVEIAAVSAGATIGTRSLATINIYDASTGPDEGPVDPGSSGGGGALSPGLLLLLALGLCRGSGRSYNGACGRRSPLSRIPRFARASSRDTGFRA